ncbi:hypothetical protein SAMN05216228_10555 [Rhizobium tibeticum]|uniref:Uncharacterized protein n=1 Tax=Rhizobium tibeticum TaxID=501024 RepID=A0A1H8W5S8_9HYPH|nr:hypothetical protein RTCCBAU85039_6384 [Rhizobium tibeticum]SEP23001.1 hypothetical protein SAMN05216228_10555 [Rhizobium tibeticum]
MALKRMDNVGIVVENLGGRLISFASSASSSQDEPRSKENGPPASLDWAISMSKLP